LEKGLVCNRKPLYVQVKSTEKGRSRICQREDDAQHKPITRVWDIGSRAPSGIPGQSRSGLKLKALDPFSYKREVKKVIARLVSEADCFLHPLPAPTFGQ